MRMQTTPEEERRKLTTLGYVFTNPVIKDEDLNKIHISPAKTVEVKGKKNGKSDKR